MSFVIFESLQIVKSANPNTGGPRYMRTFYLRIRSYAIKKKRQNSLYAIALLLLPRVSANLIRK